MKLYVHKSALSQWQPLNSISFIWTKKRTDMCMVVMLCSCYVTGNGYQLCNSRRCGGPKDRREVNLFFHYTCLNNSRQLCNIPIII